MFTFASTETIARPADVVHDRLLDIDTSGRWMEMTARRLDAGPLRVGSQLAVQAGLGETPLELVLEIASLEPGRGFAFRTIEPPEFEWEGEYRLDATDAGSTTVTMTGRVATHGALSEMEPMLAEALPEEEANELRRLKELLEGEVSTVAPDDGAGAETVTAGA